MSPKPLNRLNKQLARIKNITRNEADLLIKKGVVTVNGIKAKIGDLISGEDKIKIETDSIVHDYFIYNKAINESINDGNIADFISKTGTFVANPISKEESGLIIITNDGRLTKALLNNHYEREYILEADSPFKTTFLVRLEKGFFFQSIKFFANRIKPVTDKVIYIVFRQEKKGFLSHITKVFGHNNIKISHSRIANLRSEWLKPGEFKPISKQDLEIFLGILKLGMRQPDKKSNNK